MTNTLICIDRYHDTYEDRHIYISFILFVQGIQIESHFIDNYHHNYITNDFIFPYADSLPRTFLYFEHYSQTWKQLIDPDTILPALINIQLFIKKWLSKKTYSHKIYRNKIVYSSLEDKFPIELIRLIKSFVEPHKYKETKRLLSQHIVNKIVSY